MSAAPCMIAEVEPSYDTLAQDDIYLTAPQVAFSPIFSRPDEEEVYTSFEEAISDRLTALHERLNRLSDPSLYTLSRSGDRSPRAFYQTLPLPATQAPECPSRRRALHMIGLALIFSLVGFDLMGLLILTAR